MINYKLLDDSINYYSSLGFTRIESPWMVTEYIDAITRPKDAVPYRVESKNKNFVASGEQSFLYLYLKEYLPKGRFQTITPCMRNDAFDYTHTKYFMKNELIETKNVDDITLLRITEIALKFFKSILPEKDVYIRDETYGYDVYYKDVELGSYGIRECEFLKWIYGTGCAEPRTSKLIEKYGISQNKN